MTHLVLQNVVFSASGLWNAEWQDCWGVQGTYRDDFAVTLIGSHNKQVWQANSPQLVALMFCWEG
jgi:hypothetical protein